MPHIALLPSAGMGHLVPHLRLASTLSAHDYTTTLITTDPLLSAAESSHLSHFLSCPPPRLRHLVLRLQPLEPNPDVDPFFLHFEAIRRSAHLLGLLLASSSVSPPSALVVDVSLVSSFAPVAKELGVPIYVYFTSCALQLAFCFCFPLMRDEFYGHGANNGDCVELPGLMVVPKSWAPQPLADPNHMFTSQFFENSKALMGVDGVLVNTFDALEKETLHYLQGRIPAGGIRFPPVIAVGPVKPMESKICSSAHQEYLTWLDRQPDKSVIYVSFGSRTDMSAEQMGEVGTGLERSGCRFLWVVKTKKVDKEEDEEVDFDKVMGDEGYLDRVKGKGLVVRGWVEQDEVLEHRAVGGFLSHCGWNSVTEAALRGVKVLAWPRHGDQRFSAQVVVRSGLGKWDKGWSWEGEDGLVKAEDIGDKVREIMDDGGAEEAATRVSSEAMGAAAVGGTSWKGVEEFTALLLRR